MDLTIIKCVIFEGLGDLEDLAGIGGFRYRWRWWAFLAFCWRCIWLAFAIHWNLPAFGWHSLAFLYDCCSSFDPPNPTKTRECQPKASPRAP